MNILVLNYEYPPIGGGAAPVTRDLSIRLKKEGHNISVITMKYGDLPDTAIEDGVIVHRLKCVRRKKASCSPVEQFTYLAAVRNFMKKNPKYQRYDVCHVHFVIPTAEAARYIKKKYGIPYVITAHGSDVEGHNRKKTMLYMHRVLRPLWQKIVADSYRTVSPSRYLMDRMKHNYNVNKYSYIPNGIDIPKYQSLAKEYNKKNKILIMGRLQNFKNVQMVLNAVSKVDLKGWTVEILGDGPYRKELERLVVELGLSSVVTFRGWIVNSSEEQISYLREATVYISASRFENCPMSVLETIAAGCYPLLSDIPAHRQLIPESQYYFGVDDVDMLVDKIQERVDYGVYVFEYNLDKYEWENIIIQYMDLFKAAVNQTVYKQKS